MKDLKLLMVRNGRFRRAPTILPSELRVLGWPNYPGEFIPPTFLGKKLAVLEMPRSKLTGLKRKNFKNLTILNLEGSELLEVPNLSWAPNLVSIDLRSCKRLRKVDDSVGTLEKLSSIDLEGCHELKFFPRSLESRSLEMLSLNKCPLISACPEIRSEKLTYLGLGETSVEELSPSLRNLIGLKVLNFSGCQKFKFLKAEDNKECGTSIDSTKVSEISSGVELHKLPTQTESSACNHESCFLSKFFCNTTSGPAFTLTILGLCGNNMVSLPECIKYLVHLKMLILRKCEQLKEISVLPLNLQQVIVDGCKSLQRIQFNADVFPKKLSIYAGDCNSLSEGIWKDLRDLIRLAEFYALSLRFCGREIPPWFSCFELSDLTSFSVVIQGPTHLKSEIRGIAFCAVLRECPSLKSEKISLLCECLVSVTSLGSRVYFARDVVGDYECSKVTILRCHISESFKQRLKGEGINVKVKFYCNNCFIVKCGVHLIYGREQNAAAQANIKRIENDDENDDSHDNENDDFKDDDYDDDDEIYDPYDDDFDYRDLYDDDFYYRDFY